MLRMELNMVIDAQRIIQNVQINNKSIEEEIEKGLNKAFEELSKDGVIEEMIMNAAKKNIMDAFSRWIFQTEIRKKVEDAITQKLNKKIESYTDRLVEELAEKMNLPKD